jgi:uncharacterized protein with NRDE domain
MVADPDHREGGYAPPAAVCLLVFATRLRNDLPLVVGANRDEQLERPAVPMEVLRAAGPLVLGGRDLLAGGTWLAVNELGVLAAITNRPLAEEARDASKRSRGELPLALASHGSARAAVDALVAATRPDDYNPAWLAVADREALFTLDVTEGEAPAVTEHPPGIHVFENRPPGTESPKVRRVRALLGPLDDLGEEQVVGRLTDTLADHEIPEGQEERFRIAGAACVHGEAYGSRWSGIVTVPAGSARPTLRYADGPPCTAPFTTADWGAVGS